MATACSPCYDTHRDGVFVPAPFQDGRGKDPIRRADTKETRCVRGFVKETTTMSTVPAKQTPAPEPMESVVEKFRRLAASWLSETEYTSSTGDLVAHPAFQEI